MNRLLRMSAAATLGPLALTLAACAPVTAHSFTSRTANFAEFHTYNWAANEPGATGDPRLDNNPFFINRIHAAAERELAARGYEKASSGRPDLMLHVHASLTQRLDVSQIDQRYTTSDPEPAPVTATLYDAGTILLDFVDTKTNTVIWRGWVESSMEGVVDNQDSMEKRIDQTIAKIIATVPRRL